MALALKQTVETPDLSSQDSRKRLAKMVMALFDHWGLSSADQALLLGLSAETRATIARYRKGAPLAENIDLLGRAGHLLGIHKSLRIMFPHDRDLAYAWVTTPNRRFEGKTPLSIMQSGYEGLLAIRRYLDFERGR
jgi:hypothetical protein